MDLVKGDFGRRVQVVGVIGGRVGVLLRLVLIIGNAGGGEIRFGPDHHPKLLIVDFSIAVFIDRLDHFVDLFVRDFSRQVGQHELELVGRDAA